MGFWRWLTLGRLAAILVGCNGLSGRNVPIGNPTTTATARLAGTVVSEQDPTLPIADAVVQIVADGTSFSAKTDTDGKFVLSLPKGKTYQVSVRPPAFLATLFQSAEAEVEVDDDEVQVVIPLLPRDVSPPPLKMLRVIPDAVTLRVGERQQFQALMDSQPLPLRPVWSVHGGIGVITADGLFTATRPGKGEVRVGNLRAEAQVTVRSSGD
ncbi:MAG: carboxypeptidase regulatory-like domain-containing protein [Armatimonadota bacterium]|nr:carboxypeptidase regulatory-like domain-containing protein [Armatimonadota bacterium]MDT7971677.1 carboxypeptidase regulatory-like domain-containing protein [Armatimonadota bacterium]